MNPGSTHFESYSDLPDDCKITKGEELINIVLSSDKESNKLDSLGSLLQKGVDINFKSPRCNYNTALHLAVLKQESKVIELLINHGADTSIKNNTGETPLSLAEDQYRQYIDEILNRSTKTSNMLMRPVERQQDDVYETIKLFVKYFVKEFELRLLVCRDILEGEAEKAGKYSDTFANVTRKLTGGTMQSASGHLFGDTEADARTRLSVGEKYGDNIGEKMGKDYHYKETALSAGLLHYYHKGKARVREALIAAGCDLFQSFEMQFMGVTKYGEPDVAIKLLAKDATNRAIYHLSENITDIAKAAILGKSKIKKKKELPESKTASLVESTGFKIYYKNNNNEVKTWNTSDLFENVGLVIEKNHCRCYYEKEGSMADDYGYRRLLSSESWENLTGEYNISNTTLKKKEFIDYTYILPGNICKTVLEIIRALGSGQNHPTVAKYPYELSGTFYELGDHAEYIKNALQMRRMLYPEQNHPDIAKFLHDLGETYFARGYHAKAPEYKKDTLKKRRASYPGANHPTNAKYLCGLCGTFDEHGHHAEYTKDTLQMRQIYSAQNHLDITQSLHALSETYFALGYHEKAVEYKKDALKMKRASYPGQNHPYIGKFVDDVARTYLELSDQLKALESKKDALEVRRAQRRQKNETKIKQRQKMSLGKIELSGKDLYGFKHKEEIQKNRDKLNEKFRGLSIESDRFEHVEELTNILENNLKSMNMSKYCENIKRTRLLQRDFESTKQPLKDESNKCITRHEKTQKEVNYITEEKKEDNEIWFDVKPPVTFFTGREKELNDLHEALQSDGKAVVLQFHTISHLGGVGKSELARKYISKHCQDYDNKVVWINAESHYTISKSLQKLALNKLGISIHDNEGKQKCIKDLVSEVCRFFSRGKCIFILDSAEPTEMNEFLISSPESLFVLVTSSDNRWPNLKVFELDVFTPKEALEFLKKAFGSKDNEKRENLIKLAQTLKYFPLALQQAVAYITVENESIRAYLKKWQEKRIELRKFNVESDSDKRNPYFEITLVTCDITLDSMNKQSNGGVITEVLKSIALLQPEDDLFKMLSNVVSDEDDVKSAIKLLQQYSVVSSTHNDTFFSVHRLVQQVIRSRFEKQYLEVNEKVQENEPNKLEQESVELAHSVFHKLNTDEKYEEDNSHEEQALRSSSGEKTMDVPASNIDSLKEAAALHQSWNKFEMYDEVHVEQGKTLDTGRSCTLKILSDTALALKNTHEFNEAFEKNKKLSDKGDITLGLNSLTMLNNLAAQAHALHRGGKYDEALKIRYIVYEIREKNLGFKHSNTLTALRDIAGTLYKQGKYDEALECINQVCERQDGILEPSDALITLMHKAVVLDKQSEHKKAKEIYQQIHKKMTGILGPNHARTLTAHSRLARAHSDIGEYVNALEIYTEVHNIKRNTLGPNHLDTLFAAFDRAVVLSRLGHNDAALPLYIDVHKELKRQLGPNNETVLTISRYMSKISNE